MIETLDTSVLSILRFRRQRLPIVFDELAILFQHLVVRAFDRRIAHARAHAAPLAKRLFDVLADVRLRLRRARTPFICRRRLALVRLRLIRLTLIVRLLRLLLSR